MFHNLHIMNNKQSPIIKPLKKNVIITFCDARDGDFLAQHWLMSLLDNVDLTDIDIVVLDYGLTKEQLFQLNRTGLVQIVPCQKDGSIVVVRFRDMATFLSDTTYQQVMLCDGGDIIFQSDISMLYLQDADSFRAVCENYRRVFDEKVVFKNGIEKENREKIFKYLRDKRTINAGMIVSPRKKMIELSDFCYSHIGKKGEFGSDQLLVDYYLYKHGFVELDHTFNFTLFTAENNFSIRDGKFFDRNGDLISIVHNTGRFSFFRIIDNFGYGASYNKFKPFWFYFYRTVFKLRSLVKGNQ